MVVFIANRLGIQNWEMVHFYNVKSTKSHYCLVTFSTTSAQDHIKSCTVNKSLND